MNPGKKATKQIFLAESQFKAQRERLKQSLELWVSLLSKDASISEYVEECEKGAEVADRTLKTNLKKAIENQQLEEYVIYEIVLPEHPEVVYNLSTDLILAIKDYVLNTRHTK